eukprot:2654856-Pleurochrysis_carterae.AAC.1
MPPLSHCHSFPHSQAYSHARSFARWLSQEASTSTDLYLREHSPTRARNASERRMSWVALLSAFNEKRGEKSARFLSEKSRRSSEPDKGSTNNLLRCAAGSGRA